MTRYTQKQLKALVAEGAAQDLTRYGFGEMKEFLHAHSLDTVGLSRGTYGMNGALLKDRETGTLYAITARNSALFQAV